MDENQENSLQAERGVLRMTIGITRKATGITETYEVIGTPVAVEEDPAQPTEEA